MDEQEILKEFNRIVSYLVKDNDPNESFLPILLQKDLPVMIEVEKLLNDLIAHKKSVVNQKKIAGSSKSTRKLEAIKKNSRNYWAKKRESK